MTNIAVHFSRYKSPVSGLSDNHGTQAVQVTVWVGQKAASSSSSSQQQQQPSATTDLSYFVFVDRPKELFHLGSIVESYQDAYFHVVCDKSVKKPGILLERLDELVQQHSGNSSLEDNDDAPATNSRIQFHDKMKSTSVNLKQRLSKSSFLNVKRDVNLSSDSVVYKLLCFYISVTANNDDMLDITPGSLKTTLALDATAAQTIHLWPPQSLNQSETIVGGSPQTNSLYGLLSSSIATVSGKRCLAMNLQQPLVDLAVLKERQDAVEFFVKNSIGRDSVKQEGLQLLANQDINVTAAALAMYADVESSGEDGGKKMAFGSTRKALETLYQLYLLADQKIPALTETLQTAMGNEDAENLPAILTQILTGLQKAALGLQVSVELVHAVLDLDQAPREFLIQPSYKPELAEIAQELEQVQVELDDILAQMNEQWAEISGTSNTNAVRLDESPDGGGWQFRLPDTNNSKLLQNQPSITVHRLLKNGVYFSNKALRQLATKKQDLVAEYERYQQEVVRDAMKVAATYHVVLEEANNLVAELDVLVALAHVAAHRGYCKPTLTDGTGEGHGIVLKGARHPCVELQEDVDFIPNDISLLFGKSSFLIVTVRTVE